MLHRPRRQERRHVLLHDGRRMMLRYFGWRDPERLWCANIAIGNARWLHVFADVLGDPNALPPFYTAKIIRFPERRSEIAQLRAEVAELKRFVRTTPTAGARAGAMVAAEARKTDLR